MRIAFISADATPLVRGDGTEPDDRGRRLAALASELGAAGHAVDVFTRRNDLWSAPVVALAPNANVVHLPAGPPHFLPAAQLPPLMEDFAARFVGACGSDDGYDIVHASLHLSGLAALRLRERRGVPFVISLDDHEASAAEQRLAAAADRVVAFDPGERDRLIARYGGRSAPIEVIPDGVDAAAFAPASSAAARARLGLRPEEFVVVQRACLERHAGIDAGIRAIAALRREHAVAARLLVAVETNDFDPYTSAEIGRLRAIAAAAGVAGAADLRARRLAGGAAPRVRRGRCRARPAGGRASAAARRSKRWRAGFRSWAPTSPRCAGPSRAKSPVFSYPPAIRPPSPSALPAFAATRSSGARTGAPASAACAPVSPGAMPQRRSRASTPPSSLPFTPGLATAASR